MKKIIAVIMVVFACLVANAQEVHGIGKDIAEKLEDVGFSTVKDFSVDSIESIKKGESFLGSDVLYIKSDVYMIGVITPKYYNMEDTRLTIESMLKKWYKFKDWKTLPSDVCPIALCTSAFFQMGDTVLCVYIVNVAELNGSDYYSTDYCTVAIYEFTLGKH